MSAWDLQEVIGVIGFFVLVIAVATLVIWQFGAAWRAKAVLAQEHEYRSIADRAILVQESTERQLAEIGGRLPPRCRPAYRRWNGFSRTWSRGWASGRRTAARRSPWSNAS